MKASTVSPQNKLRKRGFALIATISILVLLALISVGLLSLSTTTVRASGTGKYKEIAQANARMALMMALGELQKHAGVDQSVTAPAGATGASIANPHWTGVWDTIDEDSDPVWLVSGGQSGTVVSPSDQLTDSNSIVLFKGGGDVDQEQWVRAPFVDVQGEGWPEGRYSWYVSDEGVKARVDLSGSTEGAGSEEEKEKVARARVAQELGLGRLAEKLKELELDENFDKRKLLTGGCLDLYLQESEFSNEHYHHLTTGGIGLPVNVSKGGYKEDLSVVFDTSQISRPHVSEVIGADVKKSRSADYPTFSVNESEKFYLSKSQSEDGKVAVGPNWGILYSYGQLWGEVQDHEMPMMNMNPATNAHMRRNDWPPYRNTDIRGFADLQHTNSAVQPVVSMLQMGFRFSAEKDEAIPDPDTGEPIPQYRLQLQMKPFVGLWNPYNVKLSEKDCKIKWALYPYLTIGMTTPDNKELRPRIFMRELWKEGGNQEGNWQEIEGGYDTNFTLLIPDVDLEPGEMRLFSVTSSTSLKAENEMVPAFNEGGGYTFDLSYSEIGGDIPDGKRPGDPFAAPEKTKIWYGGLFLEDTQADIGVLQEELDVDYDIDGVSASWFIFEAGSAVHRVSDLWYSPPRSKRLKMPFKIPEQVLSRSIGGGKPPLSEMKNIEEFAASPFHIATWRWVSRNASDAIEENSSSGDLDQGARGWIDCNPRYVTSNPLWDGSGQEGRSGNRFGGWYFISPLIGAKNLAGNNDGGPGGRGKLSEGQVGEDLAAPSFDDTRGRYRGLGGLSSLENGQPQVPLFDIPRSPLVSLGQFQHAQLSRYGYESAFPFGNSYASLRVPLGDTKVDDFNGIEDFTMVDMSHELNEALWDGYFFSTIGKDYYGSGRGGSIDQFLDFEKVRNGSRELINNRHLFIPRNDDRSFDAIISNAAENASRAMASRIGVRGAFNVHSASKEAWKAILSSMEGMEYPSIDEGGDNVEWLDEGGIRFSRFGHPLGKDSWSKDGDEEDESFWRAYRRLTDEELDDLAEEIVKEVQERAPFRSMAKFINRDPKSSRVDSQRKGCLQAALDKAINSSISGDSSSPGVIGNVAKVPKGDNFSDAIDGESQAAGYAGYILQSDVLQNLGPILTVRSDYFRIRTSGEALDSSGRVLAKAYCEAFVQRVPDYVEEVDQPEDPIDDLQSSANRVFGRRFMITSFRWLSPNEV